GAGSLDGVLPPTEHRGPWCGRGHFAAAVGEDQLGPCGGAARPSPPLIRASPSLVPEPGLSAEPGRRPGLSGGRLRPRRGSILAASSRLPRRPLAGGRDGARPPCRPCLPGENRRADRTPAVAARRTPPARRDRKRGRSLEGDYGCGTRI